MLLHTWPVVTFALRNLGKQEDADQCFATARELGFNTQPILFIYSPLMLSAMLHCLMCVVALSTLVLSGREPEVGYLRQGTSIFVPAKADHKFHGNKQDLLIFYALGDTS
jgi:hypothetical protein